MLGRSCRTRGVCDGVLYVNTGEDEATYMRRIRVTDYNRMLEFVELLENLKVLQLNPTKPALDKKGKPILMKN